MPIIYGDEVFWKGKTVRLSELSEEEKNQYSKDNEAEWKEHFKQLMKRFEQKRLDDEDRRKHPEKYPKGPTIGFAVSL